MDKLLQDIGFGFRVLQRNAGFTLVASLALALGIGASSAIFSVVDAVLLRPLPYQDPERLVWVWEKSPKGLRGNVASANFVDWHDQSTVFEGICATAYATFILSGSDQPEQFSGSRVSVDFFETLGVEPFLGRTFVAEEGEPGRDKVVVLSHDLWQSRFGSDPDLIGQPLTLNDERFTVVGVLPPGFRFRSERYQVWAPFAVDRSTVTRNFRYLKVVARLKPGVGIEQAGAEMETIAAQIAEAYPKAQKDRSVYIEPLQQWLVRPELRESLFVLFGAVGFLLLIACVNVSNLLLVRATSRQREIAIRCSLGAGRMRLIRQLLTESLILAFLGGGLAVLMTYGFVKAFPFIFPAVSLPAAARLEVDSRVLLFTLVVALLTTIFFGLAPAWQASRTKPISFLKEGGHALTGVASGHRFRRALVVAEVALALVLLTGAGLMMKSLLRIYEVDPGIRPQNVLTMDINLSGTKYSDAPRILAFYREALRRIEALPGVRSAGITTTLPLQGSRLAFPIEVEGALEGSSRGSAPCFQQVSPGYFSAVGIQLLQGRLFAAGDNENAARVAIVNKRFAKRFFPDGEVLGRTFKAPSRSPHKTELGPPETWTIVGVIKNVQAYGLLDDQTVEVYLPYPQNVPSFVALAVRTESEPRGLERQVREAILSVDRDQPVTQVATMEELVARSASQPEFRSRLLGLLASLALILATLGIYGVMSYSVAERTHEIGIRVALGAQRGEILRFVLSQALTTTFLGIGIGVAAALGLTRLISSVLYGVTPTDPLTFVAVVTVLTVVAGLASYLPARRASKVDPIVALRYE